MPTVLFALLSVIAACTDPIDPVPIEEPIEADAQPAPEQAFPEDVRDPDRLTERELILANLRPAGVPADRIDAEEIRRDMRQRRSQYREYPIPAEAQTDDPALLLARITVSEEGWDNREGMQALFQVARAIRSRECRSDVHSDCEEGRETLLSALRRLSRRVSGMTHPTRWRQYWTSTLPAGDAEEPARLWRECAEGSRPGTCEGRWASFRESWVSTQQYAAWLISQRYPPTACQGMALAWGCPDCGDDAAMARRNARRLSAGMRPYEELECGEDVNNRIWGIPPAA